MGGYSKASLDAGGVAILQMNELKSLKLAFDHKKMILDAGILLR